VLAQEIAAENDLRVKRLALDTLVGGKDTQPVPLASPLNVPAAAAGRPRRLGRRWPRAPAPTSCRPAPTSTSPSWRPRRRAPATSPRSTSPPATASAQHRGTAPRRRPSNRTNIGQAGLAFNLPLFAGFATQNRMRETLSLEEKARTDLENARRTVAQATRTAYFGLVSGQGQVKALEAAEASSQSALDANRLGYQVGVRINIDVLNSQSQLFQTKRDLAQARYNVLLGHLRLRQANGTLQPEDLPPAADAFALASRTSASAFT
jgi:outer membrane protein